MSLPILTDDSIAKFPEDLHKRNHARLMILHRDTGQIEHKNFVDIIDYFKSGDVIVGNDVNILPNVLLCKGRGSNADTKMVLLRELNSSQKIWNVSIDSCRRIRSGCRLFFECNEMTAEVLDNIAQKTKIVKFDITSEEQFYDIVEKLAKIQLPKQMNRQSTYDDTNWLRSVYAGNKHSVIFDISGLHFTNKIIVQMKLKNVSFVTLTYVGEPRVTIGGKFLFDGGEVFSGYCDIGNNVLEKVAEAKGKKNKVCAVGNYTMNSLELLVNLNPKMLKKKTLIDVRNIKKYDISICDMLLTNFYPLKSEQTNNISLFCPRDLLELAYNEAINKKYKFLTYGDSLLIV